jgi:predicted XRE-type DNA-binding protein
MKHSKPNSTPLRFEEGSGNVFADIGIPEPDLALAKVRLAEAIDDTIQRQGLTQEKAAEIMGIDQGTVSRIINERLDGFSQERLIRYLNALGNDVEILVRPVGESGHRGRVIVGRG